MKSSRSLWTLEIIVTTKRKYNDSHFVFRAFSAYQLGKIKGMEAETMELFILRMQRVQKTLPFFPEQK